MLFAETAVLFLPSLPIYFTSLCGEIICDVEEIDRPSICYLVGVATDLSSKLFNIFWRSVVDLLTHLIEEVVHD